MKTRFLTGILGTIFSTTLILAAPVFAHDSRRGDGDVDRHDSYGTPGDYGYDQGGRRGHDYPYDGYGDRTYASPYSYRDSPNGYDHSAGTRGDRGKDARHHRRGHQHHHGR